MSKFKDITGVKFGKLVALRRIESTRLGVTQWMCQCDCGNKTKAAGSELRDGSRISCGCLHIKHRLSTGIFGQAWKAMTQRCYNPKAPNYRRYGGRGISMCEHIRSSPASLKDLLGDRPEGMSIDRINNDGNYSCGSCAECVSNGWPLNIRWASGSQQCRNQSRNRKLTFKGETKCLKEWSEKTGFSSAAIKARIDDLGWSIEKALTKPLEFHRVK